LCDRFTPVRLRAFRARPAQDVVDGGARWKHIQEFAAREWLETRR
jgi:hypothetical protein